MLIFRGVPWRSLIVLIPAVVMGFGLFFFLSGRYKPWPRVVLNLFWIAGGRGGRGAARRVPAARGRGLDGGAFAAARGAARRRCCPSAGAAAPPPVRPQSCPGARRRPRRPLRRAPAAAAPLGAPSAAAVIQEVPLLSPRAAEVVRARAVFAPEDAFRRSYELAGNGVAALDPRERGSSAS